MLILVFLKILADLALYFTFGGFFAVVYGAECGFIFGMLLVLSAAFVCSYGMRRWGIARFLPLAAPVLFLICSDCAFSGRAVSLPALVYVIYLAAKEIYEPDRYSQMGIFSIFWKVFFGFGLLMIVAGKLEEITAVSVPMGLLMMAASVLLLRSLRHEPEVYLQRRYQLTNLCLVLGVVSGVWLLSSPWMVKLALGSVKLVYQWVILPLIMVMVSLLGVVVWLLGKLLTLVKIKPPEKQPQSQMNMVKVNEILRDLTPGNDYQEVFAKVVLGLCIVAGLIICLLVFRALSRREKVSAETGQVKDVRTRNVSRTGSRSADPDNTMVHQVRQQYKRFLQSISVRGIVPGRSDTSLDIEKQYHLAAGDPESGKLAVELREIYLAARYDGQADAEAVRRAKEICAEIGKIIQMQHCE